MLDIASVVLSAHVSLVLYPYKWTHVLVFCFGILYSVDAIYGIIFLEFWHWHIMLSAHFVLMVF